MVYAAALAAQGATMFLGGLIGSKIGTRYCCILGGYILASGIYLASFSKSIGYLIFMEGIVFGLGVGICYTSPIANCVRWMPTRKGLVTGIIVGGFGCGAFVFGFLAINLVNPNKVSVENSGPNANYYPADSEVVKNVPFMFEILSLTYLLIITIGSLLITEPTPDELEQIKLLNDGNIVVPIKAASRKRGGSYAAANTIADCEEGQLNIIHSNVDGHSVHGTTVVDDNDSLSEEKGAYSVIEMTSSKNNEHISYMHRIGSRDDVGNNQTTITTSDSGSPTSNCSSMVTDSSYQVELSPQDMIKTPIAHVATCFITTTVGGMYLAGTFKTFAQETFKNELFLSSVSSISSIFNATGRIFWGLLADRIGAMRTLLFLSSTFALIIGTYALSPLLGEVYFALWTWLIFFFEGGNFVLYVPVTVQLFGSKHSASNYGLIFSSYSVFVVVNITLMADSGLDFSTTTILMGLLTLIGFINLVFLDRHMKSVMKQDSRLGVECKVT